MYLIDHKIINTKGCSPEQNRTLEIRKQEIDLKSKNTLIKSNICLCTITKGLENNFLHFKFVEYGSELAHLNQSKSEYEESLRKTIQLRKEGVSNVEIGKRLGVSESTVRKRLIKAGG